MKKILLLSCFIISISVIAEDKMSDNIQQTDSFGEMQGTYLGIGGSVGIQKTQVDINHNFHGKGHSVHSAFFGGTLSIAYHKPVCRNCFIGMEVGADIGLGRSSTFGGVLQNQSYYMQRETNLRNTLSSMFSEMGKKMYTGSIDSSLYPVKSAIKDSIIEVLRYVGGSDINLDSAFITAKSTLPSVYDNRTMEGYGNAKLSDFMPISWSVLQQLGNGNVAAGLTQIRELVLRHYPNYAKTLSNFGSKDFHVTAGAVSHNTALSGGQDWNTDIADNVGLFLQGTINTGTAGNAISYDQLGVDEANMDGITFDDVKSDINKIYYPTAANDAELAIPYGSDIKSIQNNVKTKATFGVCPHIACKIGYYFKEIHGVLYTKLGVTMLHGRVTPVNNIYGLQDEKFNKIAPMIGFGLQKNINDKWGYVVELSHAFKVKKKLKDVEIFGIKLENKTSISRTNLRFMLTYKF